jgi:hypothetical protein
VTKSIRVLVVALATGCGDPSGDEGSGESTDPSGDPTTADTGSGSGLVANGGFEADEVADGQFNPSITPTRWQRYDPEGILNGNDNVVGILNPTGTSLYPDGAPEGSNVALVFLWNTETDGIPTGLSQRLTTELEAGRTYTLRVQVGNIAAASGAPYDLSGFPGYRVELLAGGEVLVADDDTLRPPDGEFALSEISYTATASDAAIGQALEIRLINLSEPESGIEVNFDDVELVVE